MMKYKNSIKVLTAIMLCSGLLSACNQTGSGANSSHNSQLSKIVTQTAVPDTQKILRISNKTGEVINSVSIISKNGSLIHQSSSGLDCADQQMCILDIGGIVTDKTMLAKFYNNKNQLVSMAALKENSAKLTYMTVYTNSTIFGANLFKQLVVFENSTPANVLAQLTKYFKHAKNAKDVSVFEDLGNYYTQQLKSGHIPTEEHFFQSLKTGFDNHQTVTVSTPQTLPPLMMAGLGCNQGLGDEVFSFLTPLAGIPEFGDPTGGVINMAKAIFDAACPSESFDFQGAFDQLNEKLDKIQASLDAVGTDIAALRALQIVMDENNTAVTLDQLYEKQDTYNNLYPNFLNGEEVNSLQDFFKLNGGIDKVNKKGDYKYSLFEGDASLIGSLTQQNSSIKNLTSDAQLKRIGDQLKAQCANYTKIVDSNGNSKDIFAATDQCTFQAIQTGLHMATLVQLTKLRMLDEVQAINSSSKPSAYPNSLFYGVQWKDVPARIESETQNNLNRILTFMQSNVFQPRTDLENMKIKIAIPSIESGCTTTRFENTRVFPDGAKFSTILQNYDSITVAISCNGKPTSTRVLLPGGQYSVESDSGKVVMKNWADWEVNETINPFISPNANILNLQSGFAIYSSNASYKTECGGLELASQLLTDQGRNELASGLSCYMGTTKIGTLMLNGPIVTEAYLTRLYIPVTLNYDGYRTFTLWSSKINNYGIRADYYGSSNGGNDYVRPYGKNGNIYDTNEPYINVWGWNKFQHPTASLIDALFFTN